MSKWILQFLITASVLIMPTASLAAGESYEVTRVSEDDTLNVREKPGIKNNVLFTLDSRAREIKILDRKPLKKATWSKINWHGKVGWVNQHFLKKQTPDNRTSLDCGGTEPFWSVTSSKTESKVEILDQHNFIVPILYSGKPHNSLTGTKVISAFNNNQSVVLIAEKATCNDGMSDKLYDYRVTAVINNNSSYSGCCVMK